uniref:Glucosinolate transporter n=1 Tax=Phyllotreta armoraciae TaxID=1553667 RepID=A0A858Z6Y2_9CUCU|nr:glucosinolate transporter [Phyllotreta armoraciae]
MKDEISLKTIVNGSFKKTGPKQSIPKTDSLFLYVSVLTGTLLMISVGISVIWTSPVIGKLKSNDTDTNPLGRPITVIEISIIAGVPALTDVIGMLVMPKVTDIIGRKLHLTFTAITMVLAGVGLAFSTSILYMTLWRCLFGFPAAYIVLSIYIAEICEDHNRGKFGCFTSLLHQIGNFLGFLIGPFLSVKMFSLVMTAPAMLFLFICAVLPETPIYSMLRGDEDKCKAALKKLRGYKTDRDIDSDVMGLKESLKEEKKGKISDLFRKKEHRIALLLGCLGLILKVASGVTVIFTYLAPFFDQANTSLSGDNVAMIVSVVKIFVFAFTSFIVDRFGRRNLLVISSTATGIPLCAVGVYFYLQHINSPYIDYLQWLPLTGFLLMVISFGLGIGLIPHVLVTELFPSDLRAASSSVVTSISGMVMVGVTSLFPIVSVELGNHWCVWWFSFNCFLGAILIYLFLPETKGKSFDEIQAELKSY